jgi:hypothetical protein
MCYSPTRIWEDYLSKAPSGVENGDTSSGEKSVAESRPIASLI